MRKRTRLAGSVALLTLLSTTNAFADDDVTQEVSVQGTKLTEEGGSAHVLRNEQLRRYSYDDPHSVFLSVPGVYVRTEDGFGLRPNIGIRGANSDRSKKITLMEDGVLFGPAPYSAPAAYYFPLIDRMSTVRVLKGPSAIVYGPMTVGGAVDLVTRALPDGRKGTYDLAIGQYGYNKEHVSYGLSNEHGGLLLEGIRIANSGFKDIDRGGNSGFTRSEWMAKGVYVVDPTASVTNELQLKATYSEETSNETYLGITDADARATPDRRYYASKDDRMENHRTSLVLTHKVRFSPKLEMTTDVYRHDLDRTWRKVNGFRQWDIADVLANPNKPQNATALASLRGAGDTVSPDQTIEIGPNHRVFVSQGAQTYLKGRTTTGPLKHHYTYGFRAHYDSIDRVHTQDGFNVVGGQLVNDGRVTEVVVNNKASTQALALWATDAVTWGPVTITPGLRVEAIHQAFLNRKAPPGALGLDGNNYQVLIPGVSGYWGITPELGVLAGVHRGFSPTPPEQARTGKPEKSINYEAGGRWTSRQARAELIGFYNDYSNITNLCTESNGCSGALADTQFDGGKARIFGAEVFGETELSLPLGFHLPTRVSYTYTYTEFLSNFTSGDPQFAVVKKGDEIPYIPPNQLNASVGLERDAWGVNVAGTFVDSMRERAGQGKVQPGDLTDAYFLLDASAKYRLCKGAELYVNGRNLTNDRYIGSRLPFGARPGAPLWIMAGLRGEF
ncbi:MAG: TonB-dependent receptor [Labilithrix sp.]